MLAMLAAGLAMWLAYKLIKGLIAVAANIVALASSILAVKLRRE